MLKPCHRPVLVIFLALMLALPHKAQRAQAATLPPMDVLTSQLQTHLAFLGYSLKDGTFLIVEGIGRAIPGTVAEAAAHSVGFRNLVTNALQNNPRFLASVVAVLRWSIDNKLITPETAGQLGHKVFWKSPKGGGVLLEPFLKLFAAGLVAAGFAAEGYEYTKVFLAEMEEFASSAEAQSYSDLLAVLVRKTRDAKSNIKLCDGMTYAQAASQLRINLANPSSKPYWKIACSKNDTGRKARFKFCGEASTVYSSCAVSSCGTRADMQKWLDEKRPDMKIVEELPC